MLCYLIGLCYELLHNITLLYGRGEIRLLQKYTYGERKWERLATDTNFPPETYISL